MVRLLYKYDKKDFIRLYINRSYRSLDDNISRILLLILIAVFGYECSELHKILFYDGTGKNSYHFIYEMVIENIAIFGCVFFAIFVLAYQRAAYRWAKRQLMREKACYIRTICFDIDCLIVDCFIFNQRIIKKIFYQELSAAKIYKNGLYLSINGKPPLYVCKPLFDTEQEYEMVCKWIKAEKKLKK